MRRNTYTHYVLSLLLLVFSAQWAATVAMALENAEQAVPPSSDSHIQVGMSHEMVFHETIWHDAISNQAISHEIISDEIMTPPKQQPCGQSATEKHSGCCDRVDCFQSGDASDDCTLDGCHSGGASFATTEPMPSALQPCSASTDHESYLLNARAPLLSSLYRPPIFS